MATPIIPGLVQDNTITIYEQMDGSCRYRISMVSKDWYGYCTSNVSELKSRDQIKDAIKNTDLISIIKDIKELNECDTLFHACKYANMEVINILIKKGNTGWDYGLWGACKGGHMSIVLLMIQNGVNDFNDAFYYACKGGNIEIAQLLIEKGMNTWDLGFRGACCSDKISTAQLMLEQGSISKNQGLYIACSNNAHAIIQFMIKDGAKQCRCGKSIAQHLEKLNQ